MTSNRRDPWLDLAERTPARIALGRAGASLPTEEVLAFALAHAKARDAIHARVDWSGVGKVLDRLQLQNVVVASDARDRAVYLRRPDFGRRLDADSRARLKALAVDAPCDVALVIGDGLSATAVETQAPAVVEAVMPHLVRLGWSVGPVVLVDGARVAIGDEIGALLGARCVAVLIGERPGLSASDSLGIYLTWEPRIGRADAERNCISNIRPHGIPPAAAASTLAWLLREARALGMTGVGLKDRSDTDMLLAGESPSQLCTGLLP